MLLGERGSELTVGSNSANFIEELIFKPKGIIKNAHRISFINGNALNISEQNNDDVERVARRRSRLIEPHPDVVNSPTHDTARRQAASGATTQALLLPRAQVGEHYGNCIRLAAENKITLKNAFDLHLIDFMGEMIKKEDFSSFRMASSSLDASAKIYAGRVDAVHQETYKVLTGLGRSDKEKKGEGEHAELEPESDGDENADGLTRSTKTKVKRGPITKSIIATNLSRIRAKVKASDADVDPLFQQQAAAYDDGGTVELRLNQLRTHSKFSELLQDSNTFLFRELDRKTLTCSTRPVDITGLLENPRTLEAPLCLTFDQFYFGKYDPSKDLDTAPTSPLFLPDNYSNDSGPATPLPPGSPASFMEAPLHDDYKQDDELNTTKVEDVKTNVEQFAKKNGIQIIDLENAVIGADIAGEGELFVSSLKSMLTAHLENFGQVNDGILGLWAGPEHWRKKAKRRRLDEFGNVAAAEIVGEQTVDVAKSSRMKAFKKKVLKIDLNAAYLDAGENLSKSGLLVRSDWSKQLITYSSTSGKSPVLREQNRRQANDRFNLLPPSIVDARKHLYELCNREIMQINHKLGIGQNKTHDNIQNLDNAVIPPPWLDENLIGENAEGEMDDDNDDDAIHLIEDDDDDDDNIQFDGIFTQPSGYPVAEGCLVAYGEDGQVDLVAPPRQIAHLEIGYARSAKLINVRQLKTVMWDLIKSKECRQPARNPPEDNANSEIPAKTQKLDEEATLVDKEIERLESHFSSLLTTLPERVSKQTAGELSVAIGLNCLLHLANEHDLMLDSVFDCTDLSISHGLSAAELANLAEYQTESGNNIRRKKQLCLDPWLEGDADE